MPFDPDHDVTPVDRTLIDPIIRKHQRNNAWLRGVLITCTALVILNVFEVYWLVVEQRTWRERGRSIQTEIRDRVERIESGRCPPGTP